MHDINVEDLNKKLSDVTQRYTEKKLEAERLLVDNDRLTKNVSYLEAVFVAVSQKITEFLNDVERLKKELNDLSQLTYTSGSPSKPQSQLVDTLQHQVKVLQQQLQTVPGSHCYLADTPPKCCTGSHG